MELLQLLLRHFEFILCLHVLGPLHLLVIQTDVFPINEAVEPGDLDFLGVVVTDAVVGACATAATEQVKRVLRR